MAFAGWRAHSPEWMAEPHSIRPLNLPLRQRLRDPLCKLSILPPPPQESLPMDTHQPRCLAKRATLGEKAKDGTAVPVG